MANDDHIAQLKKGVAAWNAWREENRDVRPDLSGAELRGANLSEGLHPGPGRLHAADLSEADLRGADLREANLIQANLWNADLSGANLSMANCSFASFAFAKLDRAILIQASLYRAYLLYADLREADLRGAHLMCADLMRANLNGADLRSAKLANTSLTHTDLRNADLTGCIVYGVSAWDVKLEGTKQQNLVITVPSDVLEGIKLAVPNVRLEGTDPVARPPKEQVPEISVDNIEVAQFVYLLLHNEKIRDVIDTITSKAVLILGRFTDERKAVLDALREELRKRDYLPILFDFAVPATRDVTETVSLLARMARFIIADLTDPSSIPKELEAIVPGLAVPVQPLLEASSRPYAMFKDYWKYEWVLPVYRYEGLEPLLTTLAEKVIAPAEAKVKALAERRRMIEAELTKPQ
jgi:uncharacterized protein YjbI with pentapeptide repeats